MGLASLREPDQYGYLSLHLAAGDPNTSMEIIRFLVEQHPQAVRERTMEGWGNVLPLHVAVVCGHPDAVELLINPVAAVSWLRLLQFAYVLVDRKVKPTGRGTVRRC